MSKYSELADRLEAPIVDDDDCTLAAAFLRELEAENERLKAAIGTKDAICITCKAIIGLDKSFAELERDSLLHLKHCPGNPLRARIAELEAERDRLRGWVKMAYLEGHADAKCYGMSAADDWKGSEARTALEASDD